VSGGPHPTRWKKLTTEALRGANYGLRVAHSWPGFRGEGLAVIRELIDETYKEMATRGEARISPPEVAP
jgi:hypothetical protein